MRYLDLFSGIGGFTIPLEELGHECIGFSEIDKYATQVYKKHFPNHKEYGDITKIDTATLPDFDLLVGGFPCQAFSIAGKRGGFDDTRGTLFFEVARILRDKKPKYFLLENVKGLLSHDNGCTFSTIIEALQEIGYGVSWKVLNSKNFGVPQNRERVFIFGTRGECPGEILPISRESGATCKIVGRLNGINGHDYLKRVYSTSGISPTLPTCAGGNHEAKFLIKQKARGFNKGGLHKVAPTLSSNSWQDNNHLVIPVLAPDRPEKRQTFTLTAQDRHGVMLSKTVRFGGRGSPHGSKQNWDSYEINGQIRRLTPLECERLQGLPDGWTEGISDSQRYKCLGNAVTVNVIRAILASIPNKLTN